MVPDKEEVEGVSTRGQKGAEKAQRFCAGFFHLIKLEFLWPKNIGGQGRSEHKYEGIFLAMYHIHIIMATPFLYDGWVG